MELKGVSVYSSSAQGRRRSISDGEMELTGPRPICNSFPLYGERGTRSASYDV